MTVMGGSSSAPMAMPNDSMRAHDLDPKPRSGPRFHTEPIRVVPGSDEGQRLVQRLADVVGCQPRFIVDENHERDRILSCGDISPVFELAHPSGWHADRRLAVDDEVDTVDHPACVTAGGDVDRPLCEAVSAFR